jgi:uroporphyrinogen-III synthase
VSVPLVVLTREPPRNDVLRAALGGLAEVVEVPLTATAFRTEQSVAEELAAKVTTAPACVVVTSSRSARFVAAALAVSNPDAPLIVVGEDSAASVRGAVGDRRNIVVAPGRSATSVAQCVPDGPALALSAAHPRPELDAELARRGIELVRVACYSTIPVRLVLEQREVLAAADVVVVAAPSAWAVARSVVSHDATVVALGMTTADAVARDHLHVVTAGDDPLGTIARTLASRQEDR